MKILVGQPKREENLEQLKHETQMHEHVDVILYPESYVKSGKLAEVASLAKKKGTTIVTGYKDEENLDRAFIVNADGEVILDRAKTPEDDNLYMPARAIDQQKNMGYLLCREVFQGEEGLPTEVQYDIIFNPIGVGMFSEEQFVEWTSEARKIAKSRKALVIGASHADGSYRNCGFSIPIAYCFDENGQDLLVSHNDIRSRIIDTNSRKVEVLEYNMS